MSAHQGIERLSSPVADFVFAHGAGAGMDSEFMLALSARLEAKCIKVHRFNFDYMAQALLRQKRRPPSKMPVLVSEFLDKLDSVVQSRQNVRPLFIGGKSMGSRVACEAVKQTQHAISGVVAYGYPFHPAKKPEKSRLGTLVTVASPSLVVQGEADALGNQTEIEGFEIPSHITLEFIPTANHDLKPLKRSGWTQEQALEFTADKTSNFIKHLV